MAIVTSRAPAQDDATANRRATTQADDAGDAHGRRIEGQGTPEAEW